MLRLLILLTLYPEEKKSNPDGSVGNGQIQYSIEGLLRTVRKVVEENLLTLDRKILDDFDLVIREMLENGTLNVMNGTVRIAPLGEGFHKLESNRFLRFVCEHGKEIQFNDAKNT